jgi:hypothetical protein
MKKLSFKISINVSISVVNLYWILRTKLYKIILKIHLKNQIIIRQKYQSIIMKLKVVL